jgi:hypothetical protein
MRLIIFIALMGCPALAFQQVDFACQQQCLNDGSLYQFCQQKCTYEVPSPTEQPQVWERTRSLHPVRHLQDDDSN